VLTRGLAGSFLVLVGGLVVSTLPASSFLLQSEQLVALRNHQTGRMLGLTIVLVGLGMLAAAWLSLCRFLARTDLADRADGVALVRQATILWSLPLLIAPPLFSRDGWSYAAQGVLTRLGVSPYEHGPGVLAGPVVEAVDPRWMDTMTPYGPLPLALGDIASRFTSNPWLLVIAHRGVALVGLALIAWAVPRIAIWTGVRPALASAVAIASPLMLANGVGGLHNDLLMVGLMAAALAIGIERGWVWGSVVGGLAAAVKLPGGLICIPVVLAALPAAAGLTERMKRLGASAAVAVGTLVGLGAVWGLGIGWIKALSVPATVNTPLSAPTVVGGILDWINGGIGLGLAPATFLDLVRTVASAASVVLIGWVALRWPTGDRLRAVEATVVLIGGLLLLSPVVHLWYLLWIVPFAATLRLPRGLTLLVLAVSVVAGLVAPLDSSLHGAYLLIVMGSMYVALAVPFLLLTRRGRERMRHIAEADWLPVP
jgi:alpha-1,6-mannosyltransferase